MALDLGWITDAFKGMDAKDWGSILGGAGNAYGAYKQGKVANDLFKLQKQDYNDEKDRKARTQARLDLSAKNLGTTHTYDSPSLSLS